MNYYPIHTNIAPNYNYLSAENAYLKQDIEFKNAVLVEQQSTIGKLKADINQLSQANMDFKVAHDKALHDAKRWAVMKKIIATQGTDQALYVVQKTIDRDL